MKKALFRALAFLKKRIYFQTQLRSAEDGNNRQLFPVLNQLDIFKNWIREKAFRFKRLCFQNWEHKRLLHLVCACIFSNCYFCWRPFSFPVRIPYNWTKGVKAVASRLAYPFLHWALFNFWLINFLKSIENWPIPDADLMQASLSHDRMSGKSTDPNMLRVQEFLVWLHIADRLFKYVRHITAF